MTKIELIKEIYKRSEDIKQAQINDVINLALNIIKETVSNGKAVKLYNFGVFQTKSFQARKGNNVYERTPLIIRAHVAPVFKPSAHFKKMVRNP